MTKRVGGGGTKHEHKENKQIRKSWKSQDQDEKKSQDHGSRWRSQKEQLEKRVTRKEKKRGKKENDPKDEQR